jgi:hypothetical protein
MSRYEPFPVPKPRTNESHAHGDESKKDEIKENVQGEAEQSSIQGTVCEPTNPEESIPCDTMVPAP